MLLRRQASTPSLHVCSLFSPSLPHFSLQAPSGAQQLGLPLGLVPHLGHLVVILVRDVVAAVAAVVTNSPSVVGVQIVVSGK